MNARATVAEDYRFIERGSYAVRADERWDVYCSFLPDGLVDLINFSSRIASFPPDPRAAEDTEILARRFGFGGTVDGEELRC